MTYEQLWEQFKADKSDSVEYWLAHDLKNGLATGLPNDGDWGFYLYNNRDTLQQEFDVERVEDVYLMYPYAFGHSLTTLDPLRIEIKNLRAADQ